MSFHQAASAVASDHEPPLVLLVEDEFLIRQVTAESLREGGYRVIEAGNADEALDMLRAGAAVDLVFSDVRMPGSVDGLGLLASVQASHPSIDVVICSGHLGQAEAIAGGAKTFIPKPYRIDDVLQKIGECLGQARS